MGIKMVEYVAYLIYFHLLSEKKKFYNTRNDYGVEILEASQGRQGTQKKFHQK